MESTAAPQAVSWGAGMHDSPSASRVPLPQRVERGRFFVIVGPDGVGKTSVASRLLDELPGSVHYCHFIPSADRPPMVTFEAPEGPPPPKAPESGSRTLGWLRLTRNIARSWWAYLRWIRPRLRAGVSMVGDRWVFGYVGQPHGLRFYGPAWLARVMVRAAPQPDVIINLVAPPNVIHDRKPELSHEQIEAELRRWRSLTAARRSDVDASGDLDQCVASVMHAIEGGGG